MVPFQEFSLDVARWLQENYPQMEIFFHYVSEIGNFELYLFVITVVYWCLNKQLGRALAYVLGLSYTINSLLKHILSDPRPYWLYPDIGLSTDDSYGVPSGHAQTATVFYGVIAIWLHRVWFWIFAIVMILLMAISRVYLGVHDLEDVLAGILVGIIILAGYYLWLRYVTERFANRILGQRLLVAVLVPLILSAIYVLILLVLEQPEASGPWTDLIVAAEKASFENYASSAGVLLGLGIGFVLEVSRVRFLVDGSVWKRIARYLVGVVITLIIYAGLGLLLPDEPLALAIPLRFIRFLLVALWISYYAPWLYVRIGLADAKPDPEVSIKI